MDDNAVRRCPTCGGPLSVKEGAEIVECEHCGNMIQITYEGDARKEERYKRADKLRLACEFDRAAGMYESIIEDYPEDAEAYMYLVLCKYGIQYVDDPGTDKKIPTCHRSSYESILEDDDYKQAVKNANPIMRESYESMGAQLEELRKNVVKRSEQEDPYDVFICYKETDDEGDRTIDSVTAHKLYEALTEKKYKVFYSHVTLAGKPGIEFEPYIYAALSSAKIMFVFGSCPEYFNAVWVKNEWKRFLKLKEKDNSKIIIPCFIDMSANDIPSEINSINATKMNKITAIQDLVEAVMKIIPRKEPEKTPEHSASQQAASSSDTLTERGYNFLNVKDFTKAAEYFNRALDTNARNHRAYWGAFLAEYKCVNGDMFAGSGLCPEDNPNYQYACKYADGASRGEYEETSKKSSIMCRRNIIRYISSGDSQRAQGMSAQYDKFHNRIEQLSNDYRTLISEYKSDIPQKRVVDALLRIMDIYAKDSEYTSFDKEGEQRVIKLYSDYMYRIFSLAVKCRDDAFSEAEGFKDALKKERKLRGLKPELAKEQRSPDNLINNAEYATISPDYINIPEQETGNTPDKFIKLSEMWTNPASGNSALSAYVGRDGKSGSVGERMLYLAEHVGHGYITESWAEYIYSLCINAGKMGANEKDCARVKEQYITDLINCADSFKPIKCAVSMAPEDWRPYWKFTEIARKITPEMEIDDFRGVKDIDYDSFISGDYYKYESIRKQNELTKLYGSVIYDYREFAECRNTDLKPWVDKAVSLAGDKGAALSAEWDKYMSDLRALCSQKEAFYSEKLGNFNMANASKKKKARIKGGFVLLAALIPLITSLIFALFGYMHYKNPAKLMPYTDIYYTIIACAICVLLIFIIWSILKKMDKNRFVLFEFGKLTHAVAVISKYLAPLVLIGAAALFIMADINFNKKTIYTISEPEDMSMLNKHPRINYILDSDLDYTDKEWNTISIKGSFDGQGHTITGVTAKSSYMIESVTGKLKNVTFKNLSTESSTFNIIEDNKGMVEGCTLDGFIINDEIDDMDFYGFTNNNKGIISECVIMNVKGNYNMFCGFANTNTNKGTVENCIAIERDINTTDSFAGIAFSNGGKIANCNSNILCSAGDYAAGIAGSSSGTISKSYVIGQIEANSSAGGIVNTMEISAEISSCYANVSIKNSVKSESYYRGYFGGIAACIDSGVNNASIKDSYSIGTIELVALGYGVYNEEIGGIAGYCDSGNILIQNCYTNMKIIMGEYRYGDTGAFIGGVDYSDVTLDSCFSASGYSQIVGNAPSDLIVENCYAAADESGQAKITASDKLKTPSFVKNDLGWSDSIWNITSGKLPAIKDVGAKFENTDIIKP